MKKIGIDTKLTLYRTPEEQLELIDAGVNNFSVHLYLDMVAVENFYQGYAIMDGEKFSVLARNIDKNNISISMFNEDNIYLLVYKKTDGYNLLVSKLRKNEQHMYETLLYGCGKIYLQETWATSADFNYISSTFGENLPKINKNNFQFCTKLILSNMSNILAASRAANALLESNSVRIIKQEDGKKQSFVIYFYDVVKYSMVEYYNLYGLDDDIDETTFKNIVKQNISKLTDKLSSSQVELYSIMATMAVDNHYEDDQFINFGLSLAKLSLEKQFYKDMCAEGTEDFIVLGLGENFKCHTIRGIVDCYWDVYSLDKYSRIEGLSEYAKFLDCSQEDENIFREGFYLFYELCNHSPNLNKLKSSFNRAINKLESDQKEENDLIYLMNNDTNMIN